MYMECDSLWDRVGEYMTEYFQVFKKKQKNNPF